MRPTSRYYKMLVQGTIIVACCWLLSVQAGANEDPKIVIIGSGVSGVAAASRLLQNGFNNVKILEAENRIGGRVYTKKFGDYWVDLGGQWVNGDVNNVAFDLAWPTGLLEHSIPFSEPIELFSSSGPTLPQDTAISLMNYYFNLEAAKIPNEYLNKSVAEFLEPKINKFFDDHHPEIKTKDRECLKKMIDSFHMVMHAGDTWYNLSVNSEYGPTEGDPTVNWREKGYNTILDILMKKYPNPSDELPIRNNTILNTEVTGINYNSSRDELIIVDSNSNEYIADHVIVTTSLGVLKANYEKLFNIPIPEKKINAIKGLEFGYIAKIYLNYDEPWWNQTNGTFYKVFYWTETDREEFANDPEKSWMLSIVSISGVEYKPRLLCCWLAGPYAPQMENISESKVFEQTKEFLRRFLGRSKNLTEPSSMMRSQWFNNKHFRGTYSYRSIATERLGAKREDLAEPIIKNGKPIILFAGEATSADNYATVHGALSSGWREADRLITYSNIKSTTEIHREFR